MTHLRGGKKKKGILIPIVQVYVLHAVQGAARATYMHTFFFKAAPMCKATDR